MTSVHTSKPTTIEINVKSTTLLTATQEDKVETIVKSAQTNESTTAAKQVEVKANEPDLKGAVDAQILAEKLEIVANQKAEADKLLEEERAR
jgi:hypothetical protein